CPKPETERAKSKLAARTFLNFMACFISFPAALLQGCMAAFSSRSRVRRLTRISIVDQQLLICAFRRSKAGPEQDFAQNKKRPRLLVDGRKRSFSFWLPAKTGFRVWLSALGCNSSCLRKCDQEQQCKEEVTSAKAEIGEM